MFLVNNYHHSHFTLFPTSIMDYFLKHRLFNMNMHLGTFVCAWMSVLYRKHSLSFSQLFVKVFTLLCQCYFVIRRTKEWLRNCFSPSVRPFVRPPRTLQVPQASNHGADSLQWIVLKLISRISHHLCLGMGSEERSMTICLVFFRWNDIWWNEWRHKLLPAICTLSKLVSCRI